MRRALIALLLVGGCALNNAPAPDAFYDFGPRPEKAGPSIEPLLLVEPVVAPAWLDSSAIVYRLAYGDDSQRQSYAQSHWIGPATDLFTARLAGQLAASAEKGIVRAGQGIAADYSLRVELVEFAHIFDSPQTSRGVAELRATLIDRDRRTLVAQKSFAVSKPARTPDASGAVQALRAAADTVIADIVNWVAKASSKQDGGLRTQD
ncbi:MAG: ABC-type transport auxiliary lipoprotein family protein [Burkholderiales bacterium]